MKSAQAAVEDWDYCLVGGGLQASLLLLALHYHQPSARIVVLDRKQIAGDSQSADGKTWSCHASDIPAACREWLQDLPCTTWPAYTVRFPNFERRVELGYCSIRSWELSDWIQRLAIEKGACLTIRWGAAVARVESRQVALETGETVAARCVIDCRGPDQPAGQAPGGYQKFFGWEVELESAWAPNLPLVMDVEQSPSDGFRFMYALPFGPTRVLLQDTCFSDFAEVDRKESAERLRSYLCRRGHGRFRIVREEHGLLPMPFSRNSLSEPEQGLRGGYRGGWFHAATGYSLPLAVRYAEAVARVPPEEASASVAILANRYRFQFGFSRFLNRLLFRLLPANSRSQVFQNFYRWLPESVIGRFYAHTFSRWDALRLFLGRPPFPLSFWRFVHSYRSC